MILVVFAGGPHTPPRLDLARELAREIPSPALVLLTGSELQSYAHDFKPYATDLLTDQTRFTLESCWHVAREIRRRHPHGADIVVVTSNYHIHRVAWILRGLLPRRYALAYRSSPDIRRPDLLHSSQARHLIGGEILSWLYCFPVGLLLRPLPTALATLLVFSLLCWRRKRRSAPESPAPSRTTSRRSSFH